MAQRSPESTQEVRTCSTRRRLATLATCNLNQWALDFGGNLQRVIDSIAEAKRQGARYRGGPELELPAYGCEDHFQELDTVEHSWECVAELLRGGHTEDILCDVGMPVIHRGVRYNCRIFLLNGKVLFIRPKLAMADDGNYRESRYFKSWKRVREVEDHGLPPEIREVTGQRTCPFGDAALALNDAFLAAETCEELFTPAAPHIALALSGVEIITNGSGSHHQLRKLHQRLDLIKSGTAKAGGVYLYANQQGCDGNRLYYDGCACIAVNGQLVAQGSQFAVADVEVVTATVDLDEVVSYRGAVSSLQEQASSAPRVPTIAVDFNLCCSEEAGIVPNGSIEPTYHVPEEEIALGPACWLWDYLRRSGASGFLLPLSGGADSSAVAAIVGSMCQQVVAAIKAGDKTVEDDARRVGQYSASDSVDSAEDLAGRLLTTVYMGTVNSGKETQERAKLLAHQVGADHLDVKIDRVVDAMAHLLSSIIGRTPRFRADGGTTAENLALQNIQARLRMVLAFFLAQLRPWSRGRSGFLLVLGTANVDECLRGYLTKYDCSSADLNPIGAISKNDLRKFLIWAAHNLGYGELMRVQAAPPTAELEPIRENENAQLDEVDMGMTYEELGIYGRLRKIGRCGPVSMFRRLLVEWQGRYPPLVIAQRVKDFFKYYSINRHKSTTLTPSYHAESYSPDDNRFDHRPFLYNVKWPWQFRSIDVIASSYGTASAI
ncbi:g5130 [Coccomyxa elongata]